jgi:hypothetical protein
MIFLPLFPFCASEIGSMGAKNDNEGCPNRPQ